MTSVEIVEIEMAVLRIEILKLTVRLKVLREMAEIYSHPPDMGIEINITLNVIDKLKAILDKAEKA